MRRPRPRLKVFPYVGLYRYSLTFCTAGRHRAFTNATLVTGVLWLIRQQAADEQFTILAYCFMPDHLHLLVQAELESSDLKRFVCASKQRTGCWYARVTRRRLWQLSYYDRVLRSDEMTPVVVRYIVGNPVRSGLVTDPGNYPFSGSDVCSINQILDGVV